MIVSSLPSVPVQPLLLRGEQEYAMFEHFLRFPWVLPVYEYDSLRGLLESIEEKVIAPAEGLLAGGDGGATAASPESRKDSTSNRK